MKSSKVFEKHGLRTFVVVLDPGEEAFGGITDFAKAERLEAASLTAIGAFARATVAWFDLDAKVYRPIEVEEQCEALSLIGDVALDDDGQPSVHIHCVLGLRDGSTRGGHLRKATVRPTLEITVVETPAHLRRRQRPDLGIALIDPG